MRQAKQQETRKKKCPYQRGNLTSRGYVLGVKRAEANDNVLVCLELHFQKNHLVSMPHYDSIC